MTFLKFQKLIHLGIFCVKFSFQLKVQYLIFNCSNCWLTIHTMITPNLNPITAVPRLLRRAALPVQNQKIKDFFCLNFVYILFFMIHISYKIAKT